MMVTRHLACQGQGLKLDNTHPIIKLQTFNLFLTQPQPQTFEHLLCFSDVQYSILVMVIQLTILPLYNNHYTVSKNYLKQALQVIKFIFTDP